MQLKDQKILLSPPHMGDAELVLLKDAFMSNWIAPLGPHVDAFELEIAQHVGVKGALAVHSGTAAIHLALKLAGVKEGDEVFCSTLTFVASANPILYERAVPVFIDSEPDTWNMSPQALARAFEDAVLRGKLPKAVIVVNLYGQSADYDALRIICDAYQVPIIEDAAESLGATYGSAASGSLGQYGIFSFNGNKIITTSGGGMLVSDDLEGLARARHWSAQARDQASHYQHSQMGYNYRMSNLLAAVGRGQLLELEERVAARRIVYERYVSALGHVEGLRFMPESSAGRSTRWLTACTFDPEVTRIAASEIVEGLAEQGIEARPVWKPLHLQPLFESYTYYAHELEYSVSEQLFTYGVCLPSGSNMTVEQQYRVIEQLEFILRSVPIEYEV